METTTPSVAELVGQMQQNLDAINYHLARISDTKGYDDEIERLEIERKKRAEILNLQWEREVKELQEKRKQMGQPAAEKRRQERERIMARRTQEQLELTEARKREDERIIARRKAEDEERRAILEQEDEELKAKARNEDEEIRLLLAEEEDRKRLEAEQRENGLYDDFDAQMTQLEDEMEMKVAESQKILAELDERRKAISAMLDAQMKPARRPTFRRGSKRYSTTPLASDITPVLAGKVPVERRPTLSNIDEQNVQSKPQIPTDLPTPAQSDHTATSMKRAMSYNGSIRSIPSEDAEDIKAREEMARINAKIMADLETVDTVAATKQALGNENALVPIERDAAVYSARQSTIGEDPEDIRAREEMARINAEIMATAFADEHSRATPISKAVGQQAVKNSENMRSQEVTGRLNAEASKINDAKQTTHSLTSFVYNGLKHAKLPTWADQAVLPIVYGSHGVLEFGDGGAKMTVVDLPQSKQSVRQPTEQNVLPFIYNGPKHEHLPTWADQSKLDLINGAWGMLLFQEKGADMVGVRDPNQEGPQSHRSGDYSPSFSSAVRHKLLPTWTDQSKLAVVKGAWGTLTFRDEGADMEVIRVPESEQPEARAHQANCISRGHPHNFTRPEITEAFTSHMPSHVGTWVPPQKQVLGISERQSHKASNIKQYFPLFDSNSVFTDEKVDVRVAQTYESEEPDMIRTKHRYEPLPYRAIVPEAAWFGKRNSSQMGHPHNLTRINSAEDFTAHMPGLPTTRSQVSRQQDLGEAASQTPKPVKQNSLLFANPIEGANGAVIEQQRFNAPNGLGNATMNHGTEKEIPAELASGKPPAEAVDGIGETSSLGNPALKELFEANRNRQPDADTYWGLDQGQLAIVEGGHEVLSFHEHGASLQGVAPATDNSYWEDQAKLLIVRGTHGILEFNENGASLEVFKEDPYWVNQATLPVVIGDYGKLVFNEDGASLKVVRPDQYWVDQAKLLNVRGNHGALEFNYNGASLRVIKLNPYWVDQATLKVVTGNHGRLAFNEDEAFLVAGPDPYWVDQSALAVVVGNHGRLVFNDNETYLRVVKPDPYWVDQAALGVVTGDHGKLTFNEDGALLKGVRPDPYWVDQSALAVVVGDHGRLIFNQNEASLRAIRPDPYWVDQAALGVVKGDHGKLTFNEDGALLKVVRPDPYWVDQSALAVVVGDHGRLTFNQNETSLRVVRPDPYWVDQATLAEIVGDHGKLAFDKNGSLLKVVEPDPYWVDQSTLAVVTGSHGRLIFSAKEASLELFRPDPYWGDQTKLFEVRGSHGRLVFSANGASSEPVRPDPYWVDQATLSEVTGSHGRLHFTENGAFLETARTDPYWVDENRLTEVRGSHGKLTFNENGASLEAFRPNPYWSGDQAGLVLVRGMHGTLLFNGNEVSVEANPSQTANGVDLEVVEGAATTGSWSTENRIFHTIHSPTINTASYWVDQAQLGTVEGSHGMLIFNNDGAATIPHEILQNGVASPLGTGDFFPDSGSVDDDDDYRNTEYNSRPAAATRTSFGPGAFASLLNRVKDSVPLVTNLVGNGSYSSFHDDSSPITPTDSNPSPLDPNQQSIDEPIIRSSWPESVNHHEVEFDAYESHQGVKPHISPQPTQIEFDPYVHPAPISRESTSGIESKELWPSQIASPIIPMSRRNNNSILSRTRALFENVSQGAPMNESNDPREDGRLLGDYGN